MAIKAQAWAEGGKVPAAVGTVADGLVIRQGHPAADMDGTALVGERAQSATAWAGLLVCQGVGLPLQQALQGAFDQPGGSRLGDLLQGVQVELDGVVAGAAGDDFAPLGSQVVQFLQCGGGQLSAWHGAFCLGVARRDQERFPSSAYSPPAHRTKLFMASLMPMACQQPLPRENGSVIINR